MEHVRIVAEYLIFQRFTACLGRTCDPVLRTASLTRLKTFLMVFWKVLHFIVYQSLFWMNFALDQIHWIKWLDQINLFDPNHLIHSKPVLEIMNFGHKISVKVLYILWRNELLKGKVHHSQPGLNWDGRMTLVAKKEDLFLCPSTLKCKFYSQIRVKTAIKV